MFAFLAARGARIGSLVVENLRSRFIKRDSKGLFPSKKFACLYSICTACPVYSLDIDDHVLLEYTYSLSRMG